MRSSPQPVPALLVGARALETLLEEGLRALLVGELEPPRCHLLAQCRTRLGRRVEPVLGGLEAALGRGEVEPGRIEGAADVELPLVESLERPFDGLGFGLRRRRGGGPGGSWALPWSGSNNTVIAARRSPQDFGLHGTCSRRSRISLG